MLQFIINTSSDGSLDMTTARISGLSHSSGSLCHASRSITTAMFEGTVLFAYGQLGKQGLAVLVSDPLFPWWCQSKSVLKGVHFPQDIPTQTIIKDSCLQGWGLHMGPLQVQGMWSKKEKTNHIDLLEFRLLRLTLKSFLCSLRTKFLLAWTDNTTMMHYLDHCPRNPNLKLAYSKRPAHHSGSSAMIQNAEAYSLSRSFQKTTSGFSMIQSAGKHLSGSGDAGNKCQDNLQALSTILKGESHFDILVREVSLQPSSD